MVVCSGAGTAYPSGVHEFTFGFLWGSWCSIVGFICSVLMTMFVILYFFFWLLAPLLRFTTFDYSFVIFKLIFSQIKMSFSKKFHLNSSFGHYLHNCSISSSIKFRWFFSWCYHRLCLLLQEVYNRRCWHFRSYYLHNIYSSFLFFVPWTRPKNVIYILLTLFVFVCK